MASAKKCDVCKTLFEGYKYIPDVTINIYRHPYGENRVDLCPECQKKLELFVGGVKEALEKGEELPKEYRKQTEYDPEMPCNKKGCDAQTRASCCGCSEQLEYERNKKRKG